MNIKCPYCKGVSEAEMTPEVGESLQCPYCARTFQFGQKISKPTRVEIPMGLNGSRGTAASTAPAASRSSQEVRGRSVSQSNFVRRDSQIASETKSGWLHNHLAIVFGIGGAVIVGLIVVVIALLLRGGDGRIEAAGDLIVVESKPGKEDAKANVANVQSALTNGVVQNGEQVKKDVIKVEELQAVPTPPNNKSSENDSDFSTPDEGDDADDFASNDDDDEKDPFAPDSVDDDEDPFSSFFEKKSDGDGKVAAPSAEKDATKQGEKGVEEAQSVIVSSNKKALVDREEVKAEYATLKKEHAVLLGAISQLDMIPDPARSVYSLSQLLGNYSLGRAYDKWSGKKWGEFSEEMLQEIGESDRKFQVPTHSPGVLETKLNALSSTLEGLKKELSNLGRKGGVRQSELKSQIDSKQKEIDGLKKKVDREIAKEELAIEKVKEGRKEAFAGIVASIKNRIEEDALKPLKVKLEAQEKAYADVIEEEKREAAERKRRAEEAREAERKKIEPIYKKRKAWYKEQLNYNGLSETYFDMYMVGYGAGACLSLSDDATGSTLQVNIVPVDDKGTINIEWPRSMPKGFAQELIESRIMMYKYENPTWEKDLKERNRWQVEEAKRQAEEEKKKNSHKGYTPKKRRIDPSLKRFKGPGERSLNRFGPGGR